MAPHRPRPRAALAAPLLLALLAGALPGAAHAQAGAAWLTHDPAQPHISPRSGGAGTEVTLRMTELAPSTPILVGVGAVGSGYEMLGQARTDAEGTLEARVKVPSWVEPDASYHFFVAYSDQRAFAVSDVFLVPRPDGTLVFEGVVGARAGACVPVRDGDDVVAVVGAVDGLTEGRPARVAGPLAEGGPCGDALTLRLR